MDDQLIHHLLGSTISRGPTPPRDFRPNCDVPSLPVSPEAEKADILLERTQMRDLPVRRTWKQLTSEQKRRVQRKKGGGIGMSKERRRRIEREQFAKQGPRPPKVVSYRPRGGRLELKLADAEH